MKKKLVALMAAAMVVTVSLAACGGSSDTSSDTGSSDTEETTTVADDTDDADVEDDAEEDDGADAGFTEYPIFEDETVGFMNLSAVYFQSVPMENETTSYAAEDADIHLEADISANENDLGYGVGDWVPYLTVDYKVETADGDVKADGTFMTMAASDGPHYGANIKLDPGTYNVTITIHSPGENGYLIHSDDVTGPGGSLADAFADGNLTYTFEGWEYAGLE